MFHCSNIYFKSKCIMLSINNVVFLAYNVLRAVDMALLVE